MIYLMKPTGTMPGRLSLRRSGQHIESSPDRTDTINCARGSLYFLPSVLGSTNTIGIHGGTIYDVPDPNRGIGNATVDATGFDIICHYMTDVDSQWHSEAGGWRLTVGGSDIGVLQPTRKRLHFHDRLIP